MFLCIVFEFEKRIKNPNELKYCGNSLVNIIKKGSWCGNVFPFLAMGI